MITMTPRAATNNAMSPRELSVELQTYYQTLLRNLPWPAVDDPHIRTIGLTSSQRREGVSTVAAHLAISAASCNAGQVLLVDSHLAWPAAFRQLEVNAGPGLTEHMIDDVPLSDVLQPGPVPNLSVLAAGGRGGNETAVYDSPYLVDLVDRLKQSYDLVIFDLPPTSETSGALRLAGLLDGVLLVLEAERVRWQVAKHTQQLLLRSRGNLLGAVLNKYQRHIPSWLYRRL